MSSVNNPSNPKIIPINPVVLAPVVRASSIPLSKSSSSDSVKTLINSESPKASEFAPSDNSDSYDLEAAKTKALFDIAEHGGRKLPDASMLNVTKVPEFKSKALTSKSFTSKSVGGFKTGLASIAAFAGFVAGKIASGFKYVGASIAAGYGSVKSFAQKLFLTQATDDTKAEALKKSSKKLPILSRAAESEAKAIAEKQDGAAEVIGTNDKK